MEKWSEESLLEALQNSLPQNSITVFDTEKYLNGYRFLLKDNSEEIALDFMNQSIVVTALQHKITHLFVPALAPVTFFTLSLLLNRSSSTYDARIRNVTALLLFGIFIEFIQYFIPYRETSVYDVIADLVGIFAFQSALSLFRYSKGLLQPAL